MSCFGAPLVLTAIPAPSHALCADTCPTELQVTPGTQLTYDQVQTLCARSTLVLANIRNAAAWDALVRPVFVSSRRNWKYLLATHDATLELDVAHGRVVLKLLCDKSAARDVMRVGFTWGFVFKHSGLPLYTSRVDWFPVRELLAAFNAAGRRLFKEDTVHYAPSTTQQLTFAVPEFAHFSLMLLWQHYPVIPGLKLQCAKEGVDATFGVACTCTQVVIVCAQLPELWQRVQLQKHVVLPSPKLAEFLEPEQDVSSDLYQSVQRLELESVHKVAEVVCMRLRSEPHAHVWTDIAEHYARYKEAMGEAANEQWLVHGTSFAAVLSIVERGFGVPQSTAQRANGAMYGAGVYFGTCDPQSKALGFSDALKHEGWSYLLVAQVLTGKTVATTSGTLALPPGYHSGTDRVDAPSMYIVFPMQLARNVVLRGVVAYKRK